MLFTCGSIFDSSSPQPLGTPASCCLSPCHTCPGHYLWSKKPRLVVLPFGEQPFSYTGWRLFPWISPHIFQDPTNTACPFTYITRLGEPQGPALTPRDGEFYPLGPSLVSDKKVKALPSLHCSPQFNRTLFVQGIPGRFTHTTAVSHMWQPLLRPL